MENQLIFEHTPWKFRLITPGKVTKQNPIGKANIFLSHHGCQGRAVKLRDLPEDFRISHFPTRTKWPK